MFRFLGLRGRFACSTKDLKGQRPQGWQLEAASCKFRVGKCPVFVPCLDETLTTLCRDEMTFSTPAVSGGVDPEDRHRDQVMTAYDHRWLSMSFMCVIAIVIVLVVVTMRGFQKMGGGTSNVAPHIVGPH